MDDLGFRYAFAKTIRGFRDSKGYTQRDMAKKLELTHACISQWENGARLPSLIEFINFCTQFQIDIEALLKEINANTPLNRKEN